MRTTEVIRYLALWGWVGIILFTFFVVIAFRTGLVYSARKDDGTLKNRIPLNGVLAMTIVPLGLIGLHLLSNYFGLVLRGIWLKFWLLYLLNFGLYFIVFIYDTLVIDGFVLATWRPAWLKIPDAMGRESMRKHILISLPVSIFIGALLTLFSTILAYYFWMD